MVTLGVVLQGYVSVYRCTTGTSGSFSCITQLLGSLQLHAIAKLYANKFDTQRSDALCDRLELCMP
jgi:hypothetical protein